MALNSSHTDVAAQGPRAPRNERAAQRVIVCDDEELIRWSLSEHLRAEGYAVDTVGNGRECLDAALLAAPDAIVLDLKMPVMDGMTCLQRLREAGVTTPVVVITAHGAFESAIEATRLGAAAYLSKPFDLREVSLKLEQAIEKDRIAQEVSYLRGRQWSGYGSIVGRSAVMRNVFDMLRRIEEVDAPTVLVTGESGTGKDLVAQAIHNGGPRSAAPFVEIDCASLPENLIESALFGHERGAFTDAKQMKRGLFEVARGGTIFLDEIGEMSPAMQAKFLRALENRRFKRVGGVVDLPLDAGIIAATNRELGIEVERGRFRQDLYYRLAIIPITLPPLRQRAEDVPLLVGHFIEHFRKRVACRLEGVEPGALDAMVRYAWPGNIRELKNVIERIVILHRDDTLLRLGHLPPEIRFGQAASATVGRGAFLLPEEGVNLEDVERSLLQQALDRTQGNQTAAARLLGITRYALRYRMEKFDLSK